LLATRSTSQVARGNGDRSPLPSAFKLPVDQGVPAGLPTGNSAAPAASVPQVRSNRPSRSSSRSGNVVPSVLLPRNSRQCDHYGWKWKLFKSKAVISKVNWNTETVIRSFLLSSVRDLETP